MLLCCRRTSCVAFFTAFLNRDTNKSKNGVTATAISVKSQFSQNMMKSMPMIVSRSTAISSVDDDAKLWMVWTSAVIVLSSAPLWCLS